ALPISALLILFQQFSLVSPFANAIAIPMVSLVVTPLALAFAVWPMQWLADLACWLLAATMWPVEWLAALPLATWQQAAPQPWLAAAALVGAAWSLMPRGTPGRLVGLLALLPLVSWSPQRPAAGELRSTVLDVGQGLAIHVQTAGHDLIYDAGPAFSAEANSGERILLPYLRAQGVGRLDMLVVTHADNDHAGGALAVLEGLPVDAVHAALPATHPVRLYRPATRQCAAGQRWEWDGVEFEMLHPAPQVDIGQAAKSNDLSCVLRIVSPHGRLLLTSDIEAPVESALLAGVTQKLPAEVVVAPHHGSRTSSSPAFVAAVAPRWVVFPVGYRNRFRHPHPEVWARWSAQGARLLRTDAQGAVVFDFADGGISVRDTRSTEARYWHGR
ncbi:MAG: DNA internalization-related competence protein ComEC/Rec2, partial [Zoogloea sp.]|nr:DNA internalization-related competence protein ComEC/Rec2 [Zoogloea sp.]